MAVIDAEKLKWAESQVTMGTTKDNYLVIKLGYTSFVLPHKEGLVLMGAMNKAEQYHEPYSASPRIAEVIKGEIEVSQLSYQDYFLIKMAELLQVPVTELREAMKARHKDTE